MARQQSFQALLDSVPTIVDYLFRNPPKAALNVFTVLMPAEVVRPEITTWRDEQRSWREAVALHDLSYHMHSLHVRGSEALRLFERLGVNSFRGFSPGAAKQFLACSPAGYVIGDGILYYLEPESFLLVGNPAVTDWVQFNCERGASTWRPSSTPCGCSTGRGDVPSTATRSRAPTPSTCWRGCTGDPSPISPSSAPTG